MRTISLLFLLIIGLIRSTVTAQHTAASIGEKSPELVFENLINANQPKMQLSDFKDKIVIIEFWASWCMPCMQAMSHLNDLQKKYPKKIKVIGVNNYDTKPVILRLLQQRNWSILISSDTSKKLNQYFPHHIIPHTVVIDLNTNIAAITSADQISDSVIQRLMRNEPVHLKSKDDQVGETNVEKLLQRFDSLDFSKPVFNLQNHIPEFEGSYSQSGNGMFSQRRMTFINVYPLIFFNYAYNWPSSRTIDQTRDAALAFPLGTYCLDVVIPNPDEPALKQFMQLQLTEALNIHAKFEKRKMRVAVIKKMDSIPMPLVKSSDTTSVLVKKRNSFQAKGVSMDYFINNFLDEWQILGVPCVNETGLSEKYDIQFDYVIGVKGSLQQACKRMGLQYIMEEREILVMVLEKRD
jgi:thiol-disulfide isomerase/thioredoxin